MTPTAPFDPNDPVDAIADLLRKEIAQAMRRAIKSPVYLKASPADQTQGLIGGAMVGAMGAIVACTTPGAELELRAVLREHLPYWYDVGLALNDRSPIGEPN